jgi:hypothetical protein
MSTLRLEVAALETASRVAGFGLEAYHGHELGPWAGPGFVGLLLLWLMWHGAGGMLGDAI